MYARDWMGPRSIESNLSNTQCQMLIKQLSSGQVALRFRTHLIPILSAWLLLHVSHSKCASRQREDSVSLPAEILRSFLGLSSSASDISATLAQIGQHAAFENIPLAYGLAITSQITMRNPEDVSTASMYHLTPLPLALANSLPRAPRVTPLPAMPRVAIDARVEGPLERDDGAGVAGVANFGVVFEDAGGLSTNEVSVVLERGNIESTPARIIS